MTEKKTAPENHAGHRTADPSAGVYHWFEQEEKEDRSSFRASLTVAVVLHIALLFATIPTLASKEPPPPEPKKVIQLRPTPKFKKPDIKPREAPKPKTRKVPIPSPDPDKIEIYVEDEILEPELELEFDDPIDFPTAPPEPEQQTLIRVGGDIKPPKRVHFVQPMYTEIARRARIEGSVIIETLVDTKGRVADAKVLKGLTFGLTEEAEKAVRQWRFEPSTLNGKPVDIVYVLTVHFRLN